MFVGVGAQRMQLRGCRVVKDLARRTPTASVDARHPRGSAFGNADAAAAATHKASITSKGSRNADDGGPANAGHARFIWR